MAITKEAIQESYPVPVFQYQVDIEGVDPIAFSEVSGLTIEVEPITYKDGLSHKEGIKYMPGNRSPVKVSLKKGITVGNTALFDWMSTITLNTVEKRNVSISLLSPDGSAPVITWNLENAFPTKLEGPSFNATSNEVALETLEIMADILTVSR